MFNWNQIFGRQRRKTDGINLTETKVEEAINKAKDRLDFNFPYEGIEYRFVPLGEEFKIIGRVKHSATQKFKPGEIETEKYNPQHWKGAVNSFILKCKQNLKSHVRGAIDV